MSCSTVLKFALLLCLNVLPIAADRATELGGGIGGGVVGLVSTHTHSETKTNDGVD